jgi:5-methylcytosine-specific restriction endonuclease McrA
VLRSGSRCGQCKLRRPTGNSWRPKRILVLSRDGYRCQACGSPANLQIDHITPIALGGSDDPSNLQTLCASCNGRKGDRW